VFSHCNSAIVKGGGERLRMRQHEGLATLNLSAIEKSSLSIE
jgi:hypothetical protein